MSLSQAIQSIWHWSAIVLTLATVITAIIVHYQSLSRVQRYLSVSRIAPRRKVFWLIQVALFAHVIEIWLFGLAYYLAIQFPELGSLSGISSNDLLGCVYFAATTFTTLGYGDIVPAGPLQFLAGTEALTGFVLITWTASFSYLEMSRDW